MRRRTRGTQIILRLASIALVLVAQGSVDARASSPLPEFYGMYAVDNGQLVELSDTSSETKPVLGADASFLYFDKNIGTSAHAVRITRAYFIRNWVFPGWDFQENKKWAILRGSEPVTLRTRPVPDQPEMINLVPREPLSPGAVYIIELPDGKSILMIVRPVPTMEQIVKRDDCVDVSVSNPYSLRLGEYSLKNASTCAEVDCVRAGNPPSSCVKKAPAEASGVATEASHGEPLSPRDEAIAGVWTGQIRAGVVGSGVSFRMQGGDIGQVVGSSEYSGSYLYCRGRLLLKETLGSRYVFEEEIVERNERATCPGGGQIEMVLSAPEVADVQWTRKFLNYKGTVQRAK